MSSTLLEPEDTIATDINLDAVDLSALSVATGQTVYTHNIVVNEFANGYHVAFNRPDSELWDYAGILFVRNGEEWRYARVTPRQPSGVVTINLAPRAGDRILYAIQIPRPDLIHIMALVIWNRS